MTSRYTNRNVAGGAPIRLVDSWSSLASIEDGVCGLPTGLVVAKDPRLVVPQWVPYILVEPGTAWTLSSNWHYSTVNPASLPTSWSWIADTFGTLTGGGGSELVMSVSSGGCTPTLRFALGASGTINKAYVLFYAKMDTAWGVGAAAVNTNGYRCTYYLLDPWGWSWRHFDTTVSPPSYVSRATQLTSKDLHILYVEKRSSNANIAHIALPNVNTTGLVDEWNAADDWTASAVDDRLDFWIQKPAIPTPYMRWDWCAVYTQ